MAREGTVGAPEMNEPVLQDASEAIQRAQKIGYPVLVVPSYVLRGVIPTEELIARDEGELRVAARKGFGASPTSQIRLLPLPR